MKSGFVETDRNGNNISVPFMAPDNRTIQEIVDISTGLSIPDMSPLDDPGPGFHALLFDGEGLADDGESVHVRVWQSPPDDRG